MTFLEQTDIEKMTNEALFDIAEEDGQHLVKTWAMAELAERALDERNLLTRLLTSIGKNVSVRGRNGLPNGLIAAQTLAENLDDEILRAIAISATDWSVRDQEDFFRRCIEEDEVKTVFDKAISYGMSPKITVDSNGCVEPQPQYV